MTSRKLPPTLSSVAQSPQDPSPGHVAANFTPVAGGNNAIMDSAFIGNRWNSQIAAPGAFEDFGDTPSAFYGRNNSSTFFATDSPILGGGGAGFGPFVGQNPSEKPKPQPTDMALPQPAQTPMVLISHKVEEAPGTTEKASDAPTQQAPKLEAYVGTHPPPPPPPISCISANGETLFPSEALHTSWVSWNSLAERWWDVNSNYPPPPLCPENMGDRVYSREEWYRRCDQWWRYMQLTYFQFMSINVTPSTNNLKVMLARLYQKEVKNQ